MESQIFSEVVLGVKSLRITDLNHNLKINVPHSLMNEEVAGMYI